MYAIDRVLSLLKIRAFSLVSKKLFGDVRFVVGDTDSLGTPFSSTMNLRRHERVKAVYASTGFALFFGISGTKALITLSVLGAFW